MATYCAVADLQKYYSPIDNYDLKMSLNDFEFKSLGSDVFQLDDSGSVIVAYRSGEDLGAAAANVGAIASENDWFYDSALDRFTIKLGSGETPEDSDIRLERAPKTWADAKTESIQIGANKVDQNLNKRFPRPIPKVQDNNTGADYDQAIIELSALYACLHLVQSSGAPEEDWMPIKERITNEAENGILDLINSGDIVLSFELVKSDEGSLNEVAIDAATTGYPTDANGVATVGYDVYLINIDVGGTFTTGTENTTIKYSVTNLAGDTVQESTLIDGLFQAIGGGMVARFTSSSDGLVYTADDKWSLTVQTEGVNTSKIGTIRMTRR